MVRRWLLTSRYELKAMRFGDRRTTDLHPFSLSQKAENMGLLSSAANSLAWSTTNKKNIKESFHLFICSLTCIPYPSLLLIESTALKIVSWNFVKAVTFSPKNTTIYMQGVLRVLRWTFAKFFIELLSIYTLYMDSS